MHIIFGDDLATTLADKYIVLELDTIHFTEKNIKLKAYSVIENPPFDQMLQLDELKTLHTTVIEQYKHRDWSACLGGIAQLHGCWAGELDTFYDELTERITQLQQQNPGPEWDYSIQK